MTRRRSGNECLPEWPAGDRESLTDKTCLRLHAQRPDSHEFGETGRSLELALWRRTISCQTIAKSKNIVHPG